MYADVLFLFHFASDVPLLYVTAQWCDRRVHPGRLVLGAAVGAGAGTVLSALRLPGVLSGLLSFPVALWMAATAFGRSGLRPVVFRLWLMGLGAGGLTGTVRERLASDPGRGGAFLSAAAGIGGIYGLVIFLRRVRPAPGTQMVIRCGERVATARVLADSGNLVRDPVSGDPVAFLTPEFARRILGEEASVPFLTSVSESGVPPAVRGVRLLRVHSLGGERLLWSIRPDSVRIDGRECRLLLAFPPGGPPSSFGGMDGIVPADLCESLPKGAGKK